MLFKRFLLVSTIIAMSGIALLQVISATRPGNAEFQVGQRLEQWKAREANLNCNSDDQACFHTAQVNH